MKMSNFKRFVATAMMAIMAIGSPMTVFADGDSSTHKAAVSEDDAVTGWGDSTNHLDKNYILMDIPTSNHVQTTFNFWVDPENILAKADKLPDNVSANGIHNDNHVYFKVSENGAVSYNSTSQSVSFNVMNYVSANLVVKVTVDNPDGNIPLVSWNEATGAGENDVKLALKLTVSSNQTGDKADDADIPTAGTEVTHLINGQEGLFSISLDQAQDIVTATNTVTQGKIQYKVTPSENAVWNYGMISLSGYCSEGEVTSAMKAPRLEFTWKFTALDAKPANAAPSVTSTGAITIVKGTDTVIGISYGAGTLAATGVSSIKYTNNSGATVAIPASNYTVTSTSITIKSSFLDAWVDAGVKNRTLTITFNDGETGTVKTAVLTTN